MANARTVSTGEWAKHLRPAGKREFAKKERKAGATLAGVPTFACMECGHTFKTLAAAEKASFGPDGCPKCGGADIDTK